MRVVLGEWIDGDAARNAAQPQRALALAGDYADVRPFSRGALCASVQPSIRWPQ